MLVILFIFGLSKCLSPVLIIPGDGGNTLEAKLTNRKDTPHFFCSKNTDWFTIWLDIKLLLPYTVDCWCENMRLIYNSTTDTYQNN